VPGTCRKFHDSAAHNMAAEPVHGPMILFNVFRIKENVAWLPDKQPACQLDTIIVPRHRGSRLITRGGSISVGMRARVSNLKRDHSPNPAMLRVR
jgi:hypothetical protein